MENEKYYVYVYLDPRKKGEYIYGDYKFEYEPFYIGKGLGNRYLKHLTETKDDTSNIFKFRVISRLNKLGVIPIILKVAINLSESNAYKLETELIKIIGRRCDKSGCLTNILIDIKPPSNYKQLSKKTINKIIKLYESGEYLKHIGDLLGLNELKVKRTLIENGITPKRKPPTNKLSISDEIILLIINNYNDGLSIRKLSDKYKYSFEVIRNILKKNSVNLRGYNYKKSPEHIAKIFANRVIKYGEENGSFKPLTSEQIIRLKDLRFKERKPIREILKIMKINQQKYYYYINY